MGNKMLCYEAEQRNAKAAAEERRVEGVSVSAFRMGEMGCFYVDGDDPMDGGRFCREKRELLEQSPGGGKREH